jgi:phage shock protein PspC (stress-responsive transcriptional regulator)
MTKPARTPIYDRSEPIFGVCEALGEDLRINPNLLRVALAPLLFWNPVGTIVGYFAMGLFLLALRLLQPDVTAPASTVAVETAAVDVAEQAQPDMPLAA